MRIFEKNIFGFKSISLLVGLLTASPLKAAEGVSELPKEIQEKIYNKDMLDPDQPVGPSIYRNWKAKKAPPWTIGYASSYDGNTWRKNALDHLQKHVIPKWKKLGLIKEVIVTQSNLKDIKQMQQMQQLVGQEVDAIFVCCSSPEALNPVIKYAYEKGIPTFSMVGYFKSPYSVNSSVNYQLAGYKMATALAKKINGKGNVLVIRGIDGTSGSISQHNGILKGLKEFPDIKILAEMEGKWTDQVGKAAVLKWIKQNPNTKLDGIVVQSASENGVLQALAESNLNIPVTIGGEKSAACYWRKNPNYVDIGFHTWPPGNEVELVWEIMMRTLQGQGPKIESILAEPVTYTFEDLKTYMGENCDRNDDSWLNISVEQYASKQYLDQFFLRPADPEKFLNRSK